MSIWNDFGFRENPYTTRPINATDEGERLLVGREKELKKLALYLSSTSTHPTIEGANGVGKTSLVSVAGYQALKRFREGQSTQLFLPLPQPFQLTSGISVVDFKRRVYLDIAQAFISYQAELKTSGLNFPETGAVDRWLNGLGTRGFSIGLTTPAGGGSLGTTASSSTSSGFDESGFFAIVERWLSDCFPTQAAGGVVCLIDNLEILETSSQARQLLEALRDELFNRIGLRWILCGARGIIRSVASSPRLQGVIGDPIDLAPIPDATVPEVVNKRVIEYRMKADAYIPVEPDGFRHLYDIVNHSLRDTLKYCEDFAIWSKLNDSLPNSATDKYELLEIWMAQLADKYVEATSGVTQRAWEIFDHMVAQNGSMSPSEYSDLGFNSQPAMRPYVKALEDAQLVVSSIDETDQRRRTIIITSRGWIVQYQRSGYDLTTRPN
jgi:hypothetical protein